jgi:hypothetical protein
MKKISLFCAVLFVFASCTSVQYGYIQKAEIIDEKTVHIYFSGNTTELDPTYDIKVVVNDVQPYSIKEYAYNIFQDSIGRLTRYRCKLNKNLLPGDKVEITGLGRSVYGSVVVRFVQ